MIFKRAAVLALLLMPSMTAARAQTLLPPAFSVADVTLNENAGSAVLTVTRSPGTAGYSQVSFATTDWTAKANVDYRPLKLTLTFYSNAPVKVRVPVLDSGQAYTTRAFTVSLTPLHNASLTRGTATVTIVDNDAPPPPPPPVVTPPPPPPPPPATAWVDAPLRGGGFARVVTAQWASVEPSRPLVVGEVVAIYTNGWGADYAGRITYAIHALSDGAEGRAYANDLAGTAPTGTAPALPADWYYGWLATANKTCPDAYGRAGYPGVTQGVQYRSTMVIGTAYRPPSGQAGSPQAAILAVPADNPYLGPLAAVAGDCLTTN